MTLSDPVGAGEIARRAGVAKATVWSWQKRHSDFPAPVQLEMGPVWDWVEVEAWLKQRPRPRIPMTSDGTKDDEQKAAEAEWYADWLAQQ